MLHPSPGTPGRSVLNSHSAQPSGLCSDPIPEIGTKSSESHKVLDSKRSAPHEGIYTVGGCGTGDCQSISLSPYLSRLPVL
jgi:hypothetical protein